MLSREGYWEEDLKNVDTMRKRVYEMSRMTDVQRLGRV